MYLYESNFYLDMLCMYINVIVHVYYRTREKMGGAAKHALPRFKEKIDKT